MMKSMSHVPPGFRFHPTDEELVDYYLRKKIRSRRIEVDVIKDIDLYKIEPWDLEELCRISREEENEWYFFSHKDKKYPTGTRTNRATAGGFWKATGRDKAIYSKHELIGMRKTLVYYKGRAPNGQKSDFIMHEYRLESDPNAAVQEEGWVICRVFKKKIAATSRMDSEHGSPIWYDDNVSFMPDMDFPCNKELHHLPYQSLHLPLLQTPNNTSCSSTMPAFQSHDQVTDWRVLDKFVASQLTQQTNAFHHHSNLTLTHLNNQQNTSTPSSTSQIDFCNST